MCPSPSMKDNYLFLKEVKNLVEKTNCELKVCFQYMNRGDRWIQVRGSGPEGVWCEHLGTQRANPSVCSKAQRPERASVASGSRLHRNHLYATTGNGDSLTGRT